MAPSIPTVQTLYSIALILLTPGPTILEPWVRSTTIRVHPGVMSFCYPGTFMDKEYIRLIKDDIYMFIPGYLFFSPYLKFMLLFKFFFVNFPSFFLFSQMVSIVFPFLHLFLLYLFFFCLPPSFYSLTC